ncbi:TolC family outer membrane protein [Prosthecomicrobium sp. N25]|uniref:TolC family outer membrane protein n=1 Tax=Prosthecomicrobium sp. N25 TaxID=3129254 RepID=UPI003077CCBA
MRRARASHSTMRRWSRAALAVWAVVLAASPAAADNLDDALAAAMRESARLKADMERQKAAVEGVNAARSAFLPTVTASIDRTLHGETYVRPAQPTGPTEPYSAGITLTQPIFDGMKRMNDLDRAKAAERAGRHLLTDTEQSVLLDAAAAYLAVVRDREVVALRQRNVELVAGIVASARARFGGGETTKTDIAQAESRLELAKADLERARGELAASRVDFEKMTGAKPEALNKPTVPTALLPRSAGEAVAGARDANPKLLAAALTADAAAFAAKSAASDLAPTVNLEISRLDQYQYSSAIARREDVRVRLGVRIPLVTPGLLPRIEEAKAVASQKRYEAIDTKVGVSAAAEASFERHRAAIRRIERLDRQVKAAAAAVFGVRKEAAAGQRTVMDELDAQEELVSAQIGRVLAGFERDYQAYVLIATMGRLTRASLGLP